MKTSILPLEAVDSALVRSLTIREWGDDFIIVHGAVFKPHLLRGFKSMEEGGLTGFITYAVQDNICEIITLNSFRESRGIGSTLLNAVEACARQFGCASCMVVTTNDNLNALGFYQKHGYCITGIAPGAVDEIRKTKPAIPMVAENGIPIRDEITLKKSICSAHQPGNAETAIKLG